VVDSSIAAARCFPDERTGYTNAVLQLLSAPAEAVAPRLFAYEVRNSILMGLRRKRITTTEADSFLNSFQNLLIHLEDPESCNALFQLADSHSLTVYDAAYLDLAIRKHLPLATLDTALIREAGRVGIPILRP
jgi:predicted nucleic acid-binding protein